MEDRIASPKNRNVVFSVAEIVLPLLASVNYSISNEGHFLTESALGLRLRQT